MPFTVVSFHAHPDDEALLTAGTLARAAADGHRVVLAVATAGEAGLTSPELARAGGLAQRRLTELQRSAEHLGCARVVCLGFADSGMADQPSGHPRSFASVPLAEAADALAKVLVEESADVLTIYDRAGGYGHPDHVRVHLAGVRAAEIAGTPVVLEATVDRDRLRAALRLLERLTRLVRFVRLPADFAPQRFEHAYAARDELTHAVDVRRYVRQKRLAMRAHATQSVGDTGAAAAGRPIGPVSGGDRTLAFCLRLPRPLFRLAFGREWFIERGRLPRRPLSDDVFASLRQG